MSRGWIERVPNVTPADSGNNNNMSDVIGNKDDTVAGDSMVALVKIADAAVDVVDGLHDVPAKDVATNTTMRDVIGNKSDTHDGDSIAAGVNTLREHLHKASKCWPTGAAGVTVTCGNGAPWTLGAYVVLVAANDISIEYDVQYVNWEDLSADGTYELHLFSGTDGNEVKIGCVRTVRTDRKRSSVGERITCATIEANGQLKAKVMSSTGNADTAILSLHYHTE